MQKVKRKNLAAKIALAVAMTTCTLQPVYAGIPVVDGTNLSQNIMSAMDVKNITS